MATIEFIESRSELVTETGCRLWNGAMTASGYGLFKEKQKNLLAHRASWAAMNGEIPAGMVIRHKCDAPLCVNPAHLILGTYQQNTQDMISRRRNKPTYGERNAQCKLTSADVTAIRASGETHQAIANRYGIGRRTVGQIRSRERWGHI